MKNVIKILKLFFMSVLSGIVANFAIMNTHSLCYGSDTTNIVGFGFPFVWLSKNHPIAGYFEIYQSNLVVNVCIYTFFSLVAIKVFRLGNSVFFFVILFLSFLFSVSLLYIFSLSIEVTQFDYSICD